MILVELSKGPFAWQMRAAPGGFDDACAAQFKAMPGVYWDRRSRAFVGDDAGIFAVCETLRAAEIARLEIDGAPYLGRFQAGMTGLEQALGHSSAIEAPASIFGFQRFGAAWLKAALQTSKAALLCDEMGLGKTIQAIVTADNLLSHGLILVVTPAVVVSHFEKEIRRWAKDPSRFRVTSYARLAAIAKGGNKTNEKLDPRTRLIIFDEIHHLSNSKSQRSKAARKMIEDLPARPFLLGLTGTLMTARIRDLWNPLDMLWPHRFGSFFGFTKRYCNGHYEEIPGLEQPVWNTDGSSRLEELHDRLNECVLRRTKSEVSLELPALSREILEVEIPRKASKDLQRALAAIAPEKISVSSILSDVEAYKIDAACELAEEIKAGGGAPLILTTRIATALEVGRRLNCPVVTGDVPPEERQAALHGFSAGAATIYSVTTGIDLTSYDSVIFVGLDWIPSTLLQAEARAHRIGQARNVVIYYLIGRGTIDEIVRERVIKRLETFGAALGKGSDGLQESFAGPSEQELIEAMIASMRKGSKAA